MLGHDLPRSARRFPPLEDPYALEVFFRSESSRGGGAFHARISTAQRIWMSVLPLPDAPAPITATDLTGPLFMIPESYALCQVTMSLK
jgi:hypothetical protein